MTNDALTKQQTDAIIRALDEALAQGPWAASNFLKLIGRHLNDIRDEFANKIDPSRQNEANATQALANQTAQRLGQKVIFIALYSSDGSNLRSWEWILANLPHQMISRPIYADEDSINTIIKTKENKRNEAYVAVYIDESDILQVSVDKSPVDKLGTPLLMLKDKAINVNNINYFVHQTETYDFTQGRLIKKTVY